MNLIKRKLEKGKKSQIFNFLHKMDVVERVLKHAPRNRRNTGKWEYLCERYLFFFCFLFLFCLFFVNSQEVFREKRKQRKSVKFKATIFVSLHPLK